MDLVVGLDDRTQGLGIMDGGVKGTVAAAIIVVDVLADDLPVVRVEFFLADDTVGVGEAVEDKSVWLGQSRVIIVVFIIVYCESSRRLLRNRLVYVAISGDLCTPEPPEMTFAREVEGPRV